MSFPNDTHNNPAGQAKKPGTDEDTQSPTTDTGAEADTPKRSRFARLFGLDRTADDANKSEQAQSESSPAEQATDQADPATAQDQAGSAEKQVEDQHSTTPLSDPLLSTASPEEPKTVADGLSPTRTGLLAKIGNVFKGSFDLDDELFDELEDLLISSDVGIEASLKLVERLRERVESEKIQDQAGVIAGLQQEIALMLAPAQQAWEIDRQPYVLLMVGVNGVGKTTTTAKIARYFQNQGKTVMLAAADTFRAAAVEQLQQWGERLNIPVVTQGHGADAAAVAHDALTSARARNIDVLLIDTAGRLHTQTDLMEQLEKVNRVLKKIDDTTPHEVMQVLDAGTGQNALTQLQHFQTAVGVNSICLTKLDGSAKGGVALALTEKQQLPIRFIGVGEQFEDLKPFNANEFAEALLPASTNFNSD